MEIKDGQHQHQLNRPVYKKCFFCIKDKVCTGVKISNKHIELLILESAKNNPLLQEIIKEVGESFYYICQDCKKDEKKIISVIVDHIFYKYEDHNFYKYKI